MSIKTPALLENQRASAFTLWLHLRHCSLMLSTMNAHQPGSAAKRKTRQSDRRHCSILKGNVGARIFHPALARVGSVIVTKTSMLRIVPFACPARSTTFFDSPWAISDTTAFQNREMQVGTVHLSNRDEPPNVLIFAGTVAKNAQPAFLPVASRFDSQRNPGRHVGTGPAIAGHSRAGAPLWFVARNRAHGDRRS